MVMSRYSTTEEKRNVSGKPSNSQLYHFSPNNFPTVSKLGVQFQLNLALDHGKGTVSLITSSHHQLVRSQHGLTLV